MKTLKKNLSLTRETVRNLSGDDLRAVAGGTVIYLPGGFQLTASKVSFELTNHDTFDLAGGNPQIDFPGQ